LPQFGDLEILYVVFDILYLDTGSVINRTLTERQELLRRALAPQQMEPFTVGALLSVLSRCFLSVRGSQLSRE